MFLSPKRSTKPQDRCLHGVGVGAGARQRAEQIEPRHHRTRTVGQCADGRHPGRGQRLDHAVDQDTGAPDLERVPGDPDGPRLQQWQFVGDVTGQGAQSHPFGCRGRNPEPDQGPRGDRADAHGVDIGAQRCQHPVGDIHLGGAHQHRGHSHCRGETDCVETPFGDTGDHLIEIAVPWRGVPAVDPDRHHFGAAGAQLIEKLGERVPIVGGPVQLHGDALPLDPLVDEVAQHFPGGFRFRRPLLGQARGPQRPVAFGPRETMRALLSESVSSAARPQPSAAANQPRKPIPVVATTMSGGTSISDAVCARNSSSSGKGTIVMAAALVTIAPRLVSSALSSSARRAEVTATRKPVSGARVGLVHGSSEGTSCFQGITRPLPRRVGLRGPL